MQTLTPVQAFVRRYIIAVFQEAFCDFHKVFPVPANAVKVGKNRIPFKDEEESDIPYLEIAVTSPPLFDEWKNELEENQIEPSKALVPEKSHKQIVKKKTDSKFKEALEKIKNLDFHLF